MAAAPLLKPHWFHVLIALTSGEQHGAAIVRRVRDATDGTVRLWPVTLQAALAQMTRDGLIEPIDTPAGQSERRRYYRLTAAGRRAASEETDRLTRLADRARVALRRRNV
jgi:DNA-binding PadR family transcriptional regulator